MAKEIERKFLVKTDAFKQSGINHKIKQAYLLNTLEKFVRVRIQDDQAFLTIKASNQGITRDEYEYEIPLEDALEIMKLCEGFTITKTRWVQNFAGKKWEIDFFENENEGLVMAEIELGSEDETFEKPIWLGLEVSGDGRYHSSSLVKNPYSRW